MFNLKYIKNEDLKGIASSWENLLKLYNPNITVAQVQEGYNAALANFNPKENDEKTKNLDILDIKRYIIEKEKEEEERKQREELRVYKASLDKDYKIKCEKCYDNGWIILSETYKFQRKDILASSTKSCSCEAGQKYMAAYYAGIEKEKPIGFSNRPKLVKKDNGDSEDENTDLVDDQEFDKYSNQDFEQDSEGDFAPELAEDDWDTSSAELDMF